jgi:RyR domain
MPTMFGPAKRMPEGWTLGPKKDSDLKQTPLLVPYAALPESEKHEDRDLALTTLKAILALGYRIETSE